MSHKSRFARRATGLVAVILFTAWTLAAATTHADSPNPQAGSQTALEAPEATGPLLNYQGRLLDGAGNPVSGTRTMTFRLYGVATGGAALWTEGPKNVTVTNGLFSTLLGDTTPLVLGNFDGRDLWLGVQVGSDAEAAPRIQVAYAPYALFAGNSAKLGGQFPDAFALTAHNHAGEQIASGTVADARIAGTIARDAEIMPTVLAADGIGSGLDADLLDGQNASAFAGSGHNHDAVYWKLGGNSGTAPGTHFLGTTDNQALELKINGQRVVRLEPATWGALAGNTGTSSLSGAIAPPQSDAVTASPTAYFGPNIIAGHRGNSVGPAGSIAQTIAGGGSDAPECGASGTEPCTNKVTDNYGTVAGGGGNTAGFVAAVAGGVRNSASGWASAVGGGYSNTANNSVATVGGGESNTAIGWGSTVAGGSSNAASGSGATVGGGAGNVATGDYSFVAGRRAKAGNPGVFVWADSLDLDFNPWSWGPAGYPNSFNVRATGGLNFATAVDASGNVTTGVYVGAGGSGWNAYSDRNAKENVSPVDTPRLVGSAGGHPDPDLELQDAGGRDPPHRADGTGFPRSLWGGRGREDHQLGGRRRGGIGDDTGAVPGGAGAGRPHRQPASRDRDPQGAECGNRDAPVADRGRAERPERLRLGCGSWRGTCVDYPAIGRR